MRAESVNLPKGWRYPTARARIKAELDGLPGWIKLSHRPYGGRKYPPDDRGGLIVEARYTEEPWYAEGPEVSVHVYAVREAEYPAEAAEEFSERVLPDMASFFRRELAKPEPVDGFPYAYYAVRWSGGEHQIEKVPS